MGHQSRKDDHMQKNPTAKKPISDADALAIIRREGWYISNAFRFKIASMQKAVDSAKKSQIDDRKLGLSDTDSRAERLASDARSRRAINSRAPGIVGQAARTRHPLSAPACARPPKIFLRVL